MTMPCDVRAVGKRRDGKQRYWCVAHGANATGKLGVPLPVCEKPLPHHLDAKDILDLDPMKYAGGIALWGAVPAVFSTAQHDFDDLGVHVHARRQPRKKKLIDQTYKLVIARVQDANGAKKAVEVRAEDAIAYMVSSIFQHELKYIECTHCRKPHLDRDWFSVTRHQNHLCYGCGKTFRDVDRGIGNPLMGLKTFCGDKQVNRRTVPANRSLNVNQQDFPLGIEIWGSHEAILWTSSASEESGIHFHGYTNNFVVPSVDETFDDVTINGIRLDNQQIRVLMAQKTLPHLSGRVVCLVCPGCDTPHFDEGANAYTPHIVHSCSCGAEFEHAGRLKKVVSNPAVHALQRLEECASN